MISPSTRIVLARLAGGAGLALAVLAGVLLHTAYPHLIGPSVALSIPFVLPVVLALAVGLMVFAAARERRAARRRQSALVAELIDQQGESRLLESAVVHTQDAVVILAANAGAGTGRPVRYVNDAFCRMTGYERAELLGRSLHLLRGPDTDPATLEHIRTALDTGTPIHTVLQNRRKDGQPYWVDLSLVPIPGALGGIAHWVMIQRDVTDRRQAEETIRAGEHRLQRSEALFRGMFEGTSAGVTLTDAAGRFVACNPAFAAFVGRSVNDVLRHTPADLTHPDDWAAQAPLMADARTGTRDRYDFQKRYLRPDGSIVWTELSFSAIRGADGTYEYGLGVTIDITARRRLEDQLRESQKMEAVGQMAGGVAHDFNNLLTIALGNLALVRVAPGDPNAAHLAAVEQSASRAADLTRQLLGFARRNQLVVESVDPRAAFESLVGLLRRTLDPRVSVRIAVEAGCRPLRADPGLLAQALANLCHNACDAMPDGGVLTLAAGPAEHAVPADATVTGTETLAGDDARPAGSGDFVRLSVSDTGVGMTDAVRTRMFDPFFTTKEIGRGAGLGLAMVRGIVEQHRGWVDCRSVPGEGTRVDLYFPTAPVTPSTPTPHPAPRPEPRLAAETVTVLLVDDEPMIREIGRMILERGGYRVLLAEDGADAVDVFTREWERIALVILDVTMPRLSGREAFHRMRAIDPAARVLFSTGYSAEDLTGLGHVAGLLNKPYRPHELLAAVRDALAAERVEG